ncbi:MAG: diphosphomevalonate decarboxylase [Chloroflexi bacterium]|nr:diphosphomevalonate decarboxylase [Chloroflexota bacterium]
MQSEAVSHPNIALIKYWGNRDNELRIPANGSISLTLAGLENRMTVQFDAKFETDTLMINGKSAAPYMLERASRHLDLMRRQAGIDAGARVESVTNIPLGAGIASSAAAYAALTLAAASALGLELDQRALSRIARRGSASAARSIYGGFVELVAGDADHSSFAKQIVPADHWQIIDLIVLVDEDIKHTGSTSGHALAASSPLQQSRIVDAPRRLKVCLKAILNRDFESLAQIVERDSDMMHAIMMTSEPPLHFWNGDTLQIMAAVRDLRAQGVSVCYTVDAGPNVHCLCLPGSEADALQALTDAGKRPWRVLRGHPGPAARVV